MADTILFRLPFDYYESQPSFLNPKFAQYNNTQTFDLSI